MMVKSMLYYSTDKSLLTENDSYQDRFSCAMKRVQEIFNTDGWKAVNIKEIAKEYHVNGTQLWQIWIENQK